MHCRGQKLDRHGIGFTYELTIAILAGGKSLRMGMGKGLVNSCGLPMVSHIIQNMGQLSGSPIVITNNRIKYKFIGVDFYPNVIPGKSSLGGLYSALYYGQTEHVAVLACDMIFSNPIKLRIRPGDLSKISSSKLPRSCLFSHAIIFCLGFWNFIIFLKEKL